MEAVAQQQKVQMACLLILTAIGIGVALFFLRPVLIPFVLAVFLVYALTPLIDVQVRYLGVGRGVAVVGAVLLGCIGLVLLSLLVWSTASQLAESVPVYESRTVELVDSVSEWLPLEKLGVDPNELGQFLRLSREATRGMLTRLASAIMSVLSNGLLVVIFMIFIMAGGARRAPDAGSLRARIDAGIKQYIITKIVLSAATGLIVGVTLTLLGVKFALAFGVLAFLMNFIPSIGSVIATLLPLPVVLLDAELGVTAKTLAFVIPGAAQFAIGSIIEPRIMGGSLDLHPVTILLGLMFFGMIWGVIGMFLATPIVAVVKIILERIEVTSPVAAMLAGRWDEGGGRGAGRRTEVMAGKLRWFAAALWLIIVGCTSPVPREQLAEVDDFTLLKQMQWLDRDGPAGFEYGPGGRDGYIETVRAELIARADEWTPEDVARIRGGRVEVGMSAPQVVTSIGWPREFPRLLWEYAVGHWERYPGSLDALIARGRARRWTYDPAPYLYVWFRDGRVWHVIDNLSDEVDAAE